MGEDVADLADGDDLAGRRGQAVQQGAVRGRDREVAAVRGAPEPLRRRADERSGNDPADPERIAEPSGDAGDVEEALEPERLLVRRDLEDAVDRGVADRPAGPEVLLAKRVDQRRPGRVAVAEDPGQAGLVDEAPDETLREGRRPVGEVAPGEVHRRARDLPMPGRRVLAGRGFAGRAPGAARSPVRGREPGGHAAGRDPARETEAQPGEVRQKERPGPEPRAVAAAGRAALRDVPDGVRAPVAVGLGIRRAPDPDGIEHDQEGAPPFGRVASGPDHSRTRPTPSVASSPKAAAMRAFV